MRRAGVVRIGASTLQTHLNKIQSIAQSAGLIADAD